VCRADVEIDFDTGLGGFWMVLVELVVEE